MLKPTSFGLLNNIYSSDLPVLLKHYYACRELCLRYKATSASLLLYDGSTEKLISKGAYINREGLKVSSKQNTAAELQLERYEQQHIVRFIGFYHYLFYWYISKRLPEKGKVKNSEALQIFREFKAQEHLSHRFPVRLETFTYKNNKLSDKITGDKNEKDIIAFVRCCIENSRKNAVDDKGEFLGEKYYGRLHKKLVKEDIYEIGAAANSYSGRIFNDYRNHVALAADKVMLKTESHFKKSEQLGKIQKEQYSKKLFENMLSVGIEFKYEIYFVGIPLIANGRCIGILRLIYSITKDGKETRKMLKERGRESSIYYGTDGADIARYLRRVKLNRSLLYTVEILGNFLEQTYAQGFMERIPRSFEATAVYTDDRAKEEYDSWASNVQKAINCYGCVLMMNETEHVKIKGRSEGIAPFMKYLTGLGEMDFLLYHKKFHPDLEKIFLTINKRISEPEHEHISNYNVVAAVIDLGEHYRGLTVENYFYCKTRSEEVRIIHDLEELKTPGIRNMQLRDKKSPLISRIYYDLLTGKQRLLKNKKTHSVRYLLLIDIPAPDVSGLIVFCNPVNRKFTLSDVRFAYAQAKRLGLGLSLRNRAFVKLAFENNLHSMGHIIKEINDMIKIAEMYAMDKIHSNKLVRARAKYQKKIDEISLWLDKSPDYKNLHTANQVPYDLCRYLRFKIKKDLYLEDAKFKGIYIDVLPDPRHKAIVMTNKLCLWKCVSGILDNAVEHAFDSLTLMDDKKENKYFLPGFRPTEPQQDGNIQLRITHERDYVRIDITNHGIPFPAKHAASLGTWYTALQDESCEHGKGLYFVRRHLEFIDAEWVIPTVTKNSVTFSIKIKL